MKQKIFAAMMGLLVMGMFSHAGAVNFANPKWNGYALDWCKNFEQGCGKPAADLWCQKKGYPQANSFIQRNGVPYQTMTIGQNAICNPSVHHCDSFASIDCQESIKVFTYPKHNGYRLDWCKQFEHECGAAAAQAFCQKHGFPQLINFQQQPLLNVPTMTVASNAICNPQYHRCDGFSYIRCKK